VGEAINSALQQTYSRVEVVCVDDGSTDNSVDVIRQFENVKSIFKSNGGQTSAVRVGLAAATGETVILLDADDVLYQDACDAIADIWSERTSYVQFKLRRFSAEKENIGSLPTLPFVKNHKEFLLRHGRFPYAPASGNAFSRDWAIKILEVTQHPDRTAPDMILAMCAPFCGEVRVIDRCLGKYRVHRENVSWRVTLHDVYFGAKDVEDEIRRFAAYLGVQIDSNKGLTGPYHYQNAIRLYFQGDGIVGATEARRNALSLIKSIAGFPGLSAKARAKNIVLGLLVLASPAVAKSLLRRFVNWSPSPLIQ
jgi:glycosyltransferase involved in cell wall biosynthesis